MTKTHRPSFYVAAAVFAAFMLFATGSSRAELNCAGGKCNCSGDKDCNTMFTSLCTDTGGSCNNDNNSCTCTQKLTATTGGSGSKKFPPGVPLKKNKTMNKY